MNNPADGTFQINLKVEKLPHYIGELPIYQTVGSSGMDVRAAIENPIEMKPLDRVLIPTGLKFELPWEYEIQVRPRSGLALKHGITILNAPGTIDSDYRGEVAIILVNLSSENYVVQPQDRIAQLVVGPSIQAHLQVGTVNETKRGAGGFGSTGRG